MAFNLTRPSNTILSHLLLFFIIDLYFLISAVITQIFIVASELVIPIGMATNKANAEIETQPVTLEAKIRKCST